MRARAGSAIHALRDYHAAFVAVMDAYEDAKAKSDRGDGLSSFSSRIGVAKPHISDFICDVELAARRSLRGADLAWFRLVYIDQQPVPRQMERADTYRNMHERISRVLGREFVLRRICPVSNYLKETDTRK